MAQLSERYQTPLRFMPKGQAHTFEALQKREPACLMEVRMVAQHMGKTVKWDTTGQVMHVVDADVGRQPSEDHRQIIV